MAELSSNQFELGGVVFGDFTPRQVTDFDPGDSTLRDGDTASPGEDGIQFGLDHVDGRLLTWELFADATDAPSARAAMVPLETAWDARAVRDSPRAVLPLRMRLPGHQTVRVYGRPRKMTPANLRSRPDGVADYVATFQTADAVFYGDVEHSVDLSLIAAGGGGITWPVTWPVTWAPGAQRQDAVVNTGELPAWPVITIRGPVAQPRVAFLESGAEVRLDVSLASYMSVVLDTRPWVRSVRRTDGASLAGAMRGDRLADMALPVGRTTVRFRGTDVSGQARCRIAWADAFSSP